MGEAVVGESVGKGVGDDVGAFVTQEVLFIRLNIFVETDVNGIILLGSKLPAQIRITDALDAMINVFVLFDKSA